MDKEKLTDLIRNILWVALLIIALIRGIASGHWKAFIILAVLFVSIKSVLLLMQLKLRKTAKELKETLESQGRPSYVPKPSEIEAMQNKANAISDHIKKQCPPQRCLFFAICQKESPITPFDSKLGGVPYWDNAKSYPTDANGRPMAMVIQINFEKHPHVDPLPQSGMLQYDRWSIYCPSSFIVPLLPMIIIELSKLAWATAVVYMKLTLAPLSSVSSTEPVSSNSVVDWWAKLLNCAASTDFTVPKSHSRMSMKCAYCV